MSDVDCSEATKLMAVMREDEAARRREQEAARKVRMADAIDAEDARRRRALDSRHDRISPADLEALADVMRSRGIAHLQTGGTAITLGMLPPPPPVGDRTEAPLREFDPLPAEPELSSEDEELLYQAVT